MTKTCSICKQELPIDQFSSGGRYAYCRPCQAADQAERKRLVKEGRRRCRLCREVFPVVCFNNSGARCDTCRLAAVGAQSMMRNFGITVEEYRRLWDAQDGKCYICLRKPKKGRRLAVDHDHRTGLIRGLLCAEVQRCNHMLGLLREDLEWLRRAADYLADPPAVAVLGDRFVPDAPPGWRRRSEGSATWVQANHRDAPPRPCDNIKNKQEGTA
jgi:hypothetical protein